MRDSFWASALVVVAAFALFFYLMFNLIPYLAIFLGANFLFIYVAIVYLLKYWEKREQPTSSKRPSVTVIIPCFNSQRTIEKCIESVYSMNYPKKLQVIAVNDASTDATLSILKKIKRKRQSLEIISHQQNQGKAKSLNLALKKAKGELIANIDSDTYPAVDALEKMVSLFNEKTVGSVTALVCVDKPKNFVQRIQELEYYAAFGFWHTALSELDGLLVTPGPMSVYSKKALLKVGGFDEDNITEDMEIALNLQSHGFKIKLTTEAVVHTEVPASWKSLFTQRLRWLRGKIFNGFKYKHMLFNATYGDFGRFVYPISFLVELFGVVVVSRILFMHVGNFLNDLLGAIGVAQVDASLIFNPGIYSSAVINSSVFFFLFTIMVWGYILWISFGIAKQKLKLEHIPPLVVFMTLYSMFISFVYFSSMVHEIIGTERKWENKSAKGVVSNG
ncbi:TPA: glycosyltransferase family 2 protein [Candidatus Micrarchaeota archaeon]|nr:glycosyltransferase family 2 protein [Candidatus Micrarchaeota archaeon]